MAKMLNALLVIFAIQIALVLFAGQNFPLSSLWSFILSPFDWTDLTLIGFLKDTLLLVGIGLIAIGTWATKSDIAIFAGISTIFLSFGTSIFQLWTWVNSKGIFDGTTVGTGWIAVMFVSPLILMYIYVIIEFWRGKD